jgi:hypothetical protein
MNNHIFFATFRSLAACSPTPRMNRRVLPLMVGALLQLGGGLLHPDALAALQSAPISTQQTPSQTDWELSGLPVISYNSDEGFGYGVLFEAYNYGDGDTPPSGLRSNPPCF